MVTLDQLEHYTGNSAAVSVSVDSLIKTSCPPQVKKVKWFKEIGMFGIVMIISTLAGVVFTNLHLFQAVVMEDMFGIREHAPLVVANTDGSIVTSPEVVESATTNHFYLDTKDHLKSQLVSNTLIFNTLPPDNRVIISDLGVDTPIVDLHYYTPEKLEKGDFKEELERGVVRYPNTGTPEAGNMLIFGHTSDYWWNNNEFGQIFRNIPKLTEGQIVKIIRNNQIYYYKITTKKVVKPKDVSKTYGKYHDVNKKYLTLVGCYPIGTASDRIVIIAEQVPHDDTTARPSNEVVQLAKNP